MLLGFWILDPLYAAFGAVLAFCYGIVPSFGVAILLLTVAVSIIRMPLVAKQVRSQREMQRIQPELKRIQTKYKGDPQKRNEEMMKLYKEHNVNPFAGCLPLLLQMPLFIVLYRLILDLGRPEPKHIPESSEMFRALQESAGRMQSFGMDLAESASKAAGVGFGELFPHLVLIALVIGTGIFQQRQMTARLPKESMNSQIAIMGKIFPVFLGLISWSIPAGVVLYFLVSNLWQIGQQAVLFRHKDEDDVPAGKGGGKVITASRVKDDDDVVTDKKSLAGGGGGGKAAAGKTAPGKGAPGKSQGGKAQGGGGRKSDRRGGGSGGGGRNAAQAGKGDRRGGSAKGGSSGRAGANGRSSGGAGSGGGGGGRAQAKGTSPQGRSRSGRGNSRKGR